MRVLWIGLELLRRTVQRAGPYMLLELVLPGGTLIALLLFVYRNRERFFGQGAADAGRPGFELPFFRGAR